MNATMRAKKWQKPKERQPLLRLVLASTDMTRVGVRRAADVAIFLLSILTEAGRWLRWVAGALCEYRPLRIRQAPEKAARELYQEYRSLHEAQPLTQFLRR